VSWRRGVSAGLGTLPERFRIEAGRAVSRSTTAGDEARMAGCRAQITGFWIGGVLSQGRLCFGGV
jgi:hypothetical protein